MDFKYKLGIIGGGNMGSAILKGVISSKVLNPSEVILSDLNHERLDIVKKEFGINITDKNAELAKNCEYILLAVKPNISSIVLNDIKDYVKGRAVFSIIAGTSTDYLKKYLGKDAAILRIMPNTPALVGEGMIVLSKDNSLNDEQMKFARKMFSSIGKVDELNEKYFDAVTGISGSGPAYVYMFIEAMADAGVLEGLPRNIAVELAAQTVLGGAKMVIDTKKHTGELKDAVCSPAGTTIEAVCALEKDGFRNAVIDAVIKCTEKSKKLGEKD